MRYLWLAFTSLLYLDVTLNNDLLKNHEFLDDPNISHTTLHVWGLVMGYTHINALFQVISINIPKDKCIWIIQKFMIFQQVIMQRDVISRSIYISNKLHVVIINETNWSISSRVVRFVLYTLWCHLWSITVHSGTWNCLHATQFLFRIRSCMLQNAFYTHFSESHNHIISEG